MGGVRLTSGWVLGIAVAVAGGSARADLAPPVPPALPGAVADANGWSAVAAQDGGAVAAIDLVIGRTKWRSTQGRWPLASANSWVAVAGPDAADRRVLRVRFLRPTEGAMLVDAKPIRLPAAMNPNAWWEGEGLSVGAGDTTVQLVAWVPPPGRGATREPRAGRLRIRWRTQTFSGGGGMRPPERGPLNVGLAFVDPVTGAVETGVDDPAETPEPAPLAVPSTWRPARGTMYWNWTPWGSAWSDKPRVFRISGSGVAGYFSYEGPGRRLLLNRLRGLEVLPPVEIAAGGEWAPQVSMDGRFVILSKGNAGVETFTLVDLLRGGAGAGATALPHLEPRFRSPFSVVGPLLFYVAEGEGMSAGGGGTTFPRWLVCVDWAKGNVRWKHPLPARFLPPPMAGAGAFPR